MHDYCTNSFNTRSAKLYEKFATQNYSVHRWMVKQTHQGTDGQMDKQTNRETDRLIPVYRQKHLFSWGVIHFLPDNLSFQIPAINTTISYISGPRDYIKVTFFLFPEIREM